ncbi:hypothetical protein AB0F15_42305 [Amycolatopsis sp. NPDC026612]|uniref:hypothetical protein n=1 Tax=Amycolatopsis sp. NPDC026612 TaxID=3155466 RepID=UPI0033C7EEFD
MQSAIKSAVSATDHFIQAHSTASSCYPQQWGGCALGVAGLGLTAGGWTGGNIAKSFVFDAKQAPGVLGKAGNYFMAGFSKSMSFMPNLGSVVSSGLGSGLGDRVNHLSAAQCDQLTGGH